MLKLEQLCQLKEFVKKMIPPVEIKYQKCYNCYGYDPKKPCYVKPSDIK